MKYIGRSIAAQRSRLEVYFWIYPKPLTRFGNRDFKLESFGIRGKLLNPLKGYLSDVFQRVLLNGEGSSWLPIKAAVPPESILEPLLFLIYCLMGSIPLLNCFPKIRHFFLLPRILMNQLSI